ncbi:ankyrin [Thozetella sp. PMI_491]|nr:ankyrin [Thozetella sp. PMI_491]
MATIQRRPVRQTPQVRLQQLASEAHLPARPAQPPVQEDRTPVTFLSGSNPQEAKDLLVWRRTWDPEYKSQISVSLSSKAKEPTFDYREVNRALKATISEGGSPGLVEALLDISRDTKDRLRDMVRSKEQKVKWAEIMNAAVWNKRYDIAQLLASRADPVSLNTVLRESIRGQDVQAVRILLQRGADPTELHADFIATLNTPNVELAELLICCSRPPCHQCRSEALVLAARAGSLHLTSLLVQRGADADWRDWSALRTAIQNRQRDVVLAIVAGPSPPRPESLDAAVGLLYSVAGTDIDYVTKVAEILLCAGARGDNISNVLVAAARNRQMELLALLMEHGASVDFRQGDAIRSAIAGKDAPLLSRLLLGKPSLETLSAVLQMTGGILLEDLQNGKTVVGKLLSAGLKGTAVEYFFHQLVLLACKNGPQGQSPVIYRDSVEIIRMLLDGDHVNVNFNDANSLRAAASFASLDLLRLLLSKSPTEGSLSAAFSQACGIPPDSPARIEVLTILLDAGVRGAVADQALAIAVSRGRSAIPEVGLLLRVASVDYNQGASLRAALMQPDGELFDMLLARQPSESTLQHAWDAAAQLKDSQLQYRVYKRLLEFNAKVAPLDRELIAAVPKGPAALSLCELLLSYGANVETNEGLPLNAAVNTQNLAVLNLLLQKKPSASALGSAAQSAWLLPRDTRMEVAQALLAHGLEQTSLDRGLLATATERPPYTPLVKLLLDHGASPEFNQGEAVLRAAEGGDRELLALLLPRVASPECLTNALGVVLDHSDWQTPSNLSLVSDLLTHGARGPWIDFSFVEACVSFNPDAYLLLMEYISADSILTDALREVVSQESIWQQPAGLAVTEALLTRGASESVVRPALVQAASVFSVPAVSVLRNYVRDPATLEAAWGEATLTNHDWLEESNLQVLELLLASGVRSDLNFTLARAVAASSGDKEMISLVEMLLRYGADANNNNGQPLLWAARRGNAALVKMLCLYQPSAEALRLAFFEVLRGHARYDPDQALGCLRPLIEAPQSRLDLNHAPDGEDPLLIQIITRYPTAPAIVQLAVHAGADVMSTATCPLLLTDGDDWRSISGHKRGEMDPAGLRFSEEVPALIWALMRPNTELSDATIEALIELGADVNFHTPYLRMTPLILAAKHNRPAVVAKLLQYGARQDEKDNFENTALFYASRHGHIDCVRILLAQSTAINDGSLHEAARYLHAGVVQLLTHAGHNPNFPSTLHGDRTALGELCLLADASSQALDATLDALAAAGADPGPTPGASMPAIFLALSNANPRRIMEGLTGIVIQESLGSQRLIHVQDQLAYSPTMYLKKLILPAVGQARRVSPIPAIQPGIPYPAGGDLQAIDLPNASQAFHVAVATAYSDLLNFLVRKGATDRFYYTGTDMVQPADMIGAPDHIADRETIRRQQMGHLQGPVPMGASNGFYSSTPTLGSRAGREDELHMQSDAQRRMAEGSRQIQDRRVLSDLVDRHRTESRDLRQQAQQLVQKSLRKLQLDREGLESGWLASQLAAARRLGGYSLGDVDAEFLRRKDDEATELLADVREMRLVEHQRAMAVCFPDEWERWLARRPMPVAIGRAPSGGQRVDDYPQDGTKVASIVTTLPIRTY